MKIIKFSLILFTAILLLCLFVSGVSAASVCQHTPSDAVEESFEAETCTTDGYYDIVIYCVKCDEELSRRTYTIPKRGHKAGSTKKENVVKATYTKEGSYEKVTYCSVCSEEMKTKKVTVKKKTLSQVSGITWQALSDSQIKLSWKKVKDADGYRIYKYNPSEKKWVKIKTTTSLSYTVKGLEAGKSVKFRVKAYKKADGLTVWGSASATVTASATPAAVKNGKIVSKAANSVTLSWEKAEGAAGYRIYRYNKSTKKWEKVKTTSSGSYTVKNLKAGTAYKFRIKAYTKTDGKTLWGKATPTITVETKTR